MIKTTAFALLLACGSIAANATTMPVRIAAPAASVIPVGEGCGAGMWRGPNGGCNPFRTPYGTNRGTVYECPPGWLIGPGGKRCFPIRR